MKIAKIILYAVIAIQAITMIVDRTNKIIPTFYMLIIISILNILEGIDFYRGDKKIHAITVFVVGLFVMGVAVVGLYLGNPIN